MEYTAFKPVVFLAFANEQETRTAYLRNLPEEVRRLRATLEKAQAAGLCELVMRTNTTLDEILAVFREHRNRIAVVHYGGHANGYALLLESATGQAAVAGAGGLATFLSQQTGLQLVFLNGCSTQEQVQGLLHAGVPVVIATSQAIDDGIATEFADQFYRGLASGAKLQTAFKEAEGAVDAAHSGQPRGALYRVHETMEDRCPWALHVRAGAEVALEWNLPDFVGNPLFDLPGLPEKYLQNLPENPFRGLYWFTREQAGVFFGRGYQIRKLYQQITAPDSLPIILFYGQSGVGKSSLLAAGLLPRMECSHTVYYLRREQQIGMLGTLQAAFAMSSEQSLAEAWLATEERYHRPLLVVLDQVEEVFTHPNENQPDELANLLDALQTVFADSAHWPQGKLILSFRKEWLAEITRQVEEHRLPYTEAFLQRLDKRGVIDAINGPTVLKGLQAKYRLDVKEDLPSIIADDLLADRESAVAPTLQILLTKMWDRAKDKCYDQPTFNLDLYDEMRKQGLDLQAVLDQQLAELHEQQPSAVDSGLALDLLAFHTTSLGTAAEHTQDELYQVYAHQQTALEPLVRGCKDLYLLVDPKENQPKQSPSSRLAHDTLAPLVRQRFDKSDKPGQRARRILESRALDWQAGKAAAVLDEPDLQTVETGVNGMRVWLADEKRLVEASRKERDKRARNRRFWQGIGITAVLLIIIAAAVAGWQWQVAEARRKEAEARREEAYSSALAAYARQAQSNGDDDRAIAAAYKANIITDSPPKQAQTTLAQVAYYTPGTSRLFVGHEEAVTSVAFSPDGKSILSGSTDRSVILWNVAAVESKIVRRFTEHTAEVTSVAYDPTNPSRFISGSKDGTVILHNLETGETKVFHHTGSVNSVAFHPNSASILAGGDNGVVVLWDVNSGQARWQHESARQINSVTFTPDGSKAIAGTHHGGPDSDTIYIWAVDSGEELHKIEGASTYGVSSLAVSPDSRQLLSGAGGYNPSAYLWDIDSEASIATLSGQQAGDVRVAFDPTNLQYAATGAYDNQIILWNIQNRSEIQRFIGHTGRITGLVFSPDGRRLLSGSRDKTLRLWDIWGGAERARYQGIANAASSVTYSRDGEVVAASYVDSDGSVYVWRKTNPNSQIFSLGRRASDIDLSPDGHTLLAGLAQPDSNLVLWDLDSNRELHRFTQDGWITGVAFSPNDANVALVSSYGDSNQPGFPRGITLALWNVATGQKLLDLRRHEHIVRDIVFSPDGHQALSGSNDRTAIIWNLDTGNVEHTLRGHLEAVTSVAFVPADGKQALTGSDDKTVIIWDVQQGIALHTLTGHKARITTVAVSQDGTRAVSGSEDGTIIIWDLGTYTEITRMVGHSSSVNKLVFCGNQHHVFSAGHDTTVRLWDIEPPADVVTWTAENRYVRELRAEEYQMVGIAPR